MNEITEKQNLPKQIDYLSAQRCLYGKAKTILAVQILIAGPVGIATAFVSFKYPCIKGCVALWGIIVVLADVLWLTPWQKRLRSHASHIQELFDCEVLSLSWNRIKAGAKPDPELIYKYAEKYKKFRLKAPSLYDWYSTEVAELPIYIARIACQRSNCWWDSSQRKRYAILVIALVLLAFVSLLLWGVYKGMTLESFMLSVVAPLSPAFFLGIRQYSEQTEATSRVEKLKECAMTLWNDALDAKNETESESSSRMLQDEILDHRKRSPLVFDWIYGLLRDDHEDQMSHGVSIFVEDAKRRLDIK